MSNFYTQNVKIKKILEDIIDYAYPNSDMRNKYKSFYFRISDKNVASYAGMYHQSGHLIEIVGLDRDGKHIVITCIHELSHHIDYINRHTSDHGKEFYEIYRRLLYTALNMRIFKPEDATMEDVADHNKIRKMIDDWRPSFINYKTDMSVIEIRNCFEVKDVLKNRGYSYNSLNKAWCLEIADVNTEIEKDWLMSLGLKDSDIAVKDASDVDIEARLKIIVTGKGTYTHKDYLKENGFKYSDKKWVKYLSVTDDKKKLLNEYSTVLTDCKIKFST